MTVQKQPKAEWGRYAITPRIVRTQYKDLTHAEKWFYTCLKDLCGDKGVCYRTLRSLSEETDISTGSLSTMIPRLHKAGLIHAEKKRRSNNPTAKEVWHITIVDIWQSNVEECSKYEQYQENVQNMNEVTEERSSTEQQCSNPEPKRSANEPKRSDFADRRIVIEEEETKNNNEGYVVSAARTDTTPRTPERNEDADVFDSLDDSLSRRRDRRDTLQTSIDAEREAPGNTHPIGAGKQPRTSAAGKRAATSSSAVVLSEQEQAFYDLYCSMPWMKIKPTINEKVKEECAKLAPHFKTQQDLYDLRKFMNTKDFFRGKFNLPIVVLAVNDYAMTQEAPVEDETMVNGKPRKYYSSFDDPTFDPEKFNENEFYPVKPIVQTQQAEVYV